MTKPASAPRTKAGQTLLERLTQDEDYEWGNRIHSSILAIEDEAMDLGRERHRAIQRASRLAEEDEYAADLRAALERLVEAWDSGWSDTSESGSFIAAMEQARAALHADQRGREEET